MARVWRHIVVHICLAAFLFANTPGGLARAASRLGRLPKRPDPCGACCDVASKAMTTPGLTSQAAQCCKCRCSGRHSDQNSPNQQPVIAREDAPRPRCPCCPSFPCCPGGCSWCSVAKVPCCGLAQIPAPEQSRLGSLLAEASLLFPPTVCNEMIRPPRS